MTQPITDERPAHLRKAIPGTLESRTYNIYKITLEEDGTLPATWSVTAPDACLSADGKSKIIVLSAASACAFDAFRSFGFRQPDGCPTIHKLSGVAGQYIQTLDRAIHGLFDDEPGWTLVAGRPAAHDVPALDRLDAC